MDYSTKTYVQSYDCLLLVDLHENKPAGRTHFHLFWIALYKDSFWHRGKRQIGEDLFNKVNVVSMAGSFSQWSLTPKCTLTLKYISAPSQLDLLKVCVFVTTFVGDTSSILPPHLTLSNFLPLIQSVLTGLGCLVEAHGWLTAIFQPLGWFSI